MATDETKCKKQLSYLVEQVSAMAISNTQICCAHHNFRECMMTAASRHCDPQNNGAAVHFARDMFSKALGFLLKQCADYMYAVTNLSIDPKNHFPGRFPSTARGQ